MFGSVTHEKLDHIQHQLNHIMATITQLTAAMDRINAAVTAVGTRITDLEATVASSITPADSDALLGTMESAATTLEGMAPPVTPAG